jgi:hypothetical protein
MSECCEELIPGLLDGSMGVPVYKKDKPLAFQLRSTIQHPPVLSVKPWFEILYPLKQGYWQLCPSS